MAESTRKSRRRKPAPSGKSLPKKNDPSGELISQRACLAELRRFGSLTKELVSLLALPKELYSHGSAERPSFSSDPGLSIKRYAAALMQEREFVPPEGPPGYGISIATRGSGVFCVLVDRKRGIIVAEAVSHLHGASGSWRPFTAALKEALEFGDWIRSQKSDFRFVMRGIRRELYQ